MTNITLSIDEEVFKKMKRHSDIKWSEFVRRIIEKRVNELDCLERAGNKESILTMLASEEVLKKEWNNDYDKRWDDEQI
jgi:predicted CopG family antitoxin